VIGGVFNSRTRTGVIAVAGSILSEVGRWLLYAPAAALVIYVLHAVFRLY
jgi:hypothetical protein